MQTFELHIDSLINNQTAIDCLSASCPQVSKQKLKLAMKYGAVWLTVGNNKTIRIRRAKKVLSVGDKLSIYYDEKILFSAIEPAKLIADEGEYSIWNKPQGMFSQGTKWGDHTSIVRWVELFGLEKNKQKLRPTFLVHRLDRATSGIILVAHSKKTAVSLTSLFEHRKMEKRYRAVVSGKFPTALVLQELTQDIDGKNALTKVLISDYDDKTDQSTLMVSIKTGRKHQIRIHLSELGFSIIGDRLYGTDDLKTTYESNLMLKSCYLSFVCPITQLNREYKISQ